MTDERRGEQMGIKRDKKREGELREGRGGEKRLNRRSEE